MDPNAPQTIIPATLWLALFPLTFLIHFAEEYWGGEGYPAYLLRLRGVHLPVGRFLFFQGLGFVFFSSLALISILLGFPTFMIPLLGGFFLCNGLSHTVTALWDRHYGPGLLSSVFLWGPLGLFSIVGMIGVEPWWRLIIAAVIGASMNGGVAFFTMKGGKIL